MKEDELNHRLRELIDIASGQKTNKQNNVVYKESSIQPKMSKKAEKQIAKIANSLQELQLCVKYLLFDVEATRRERDRLQARLDNQPPPTPPD